jgi:hypothetical protein
MIDRNWSSRPGLRLAPAAVLLGLAALVGACSSPMTTTRTTSTQQTTTTQPGPGIQQ